MDLLLSVAHFPADPYQPAAVGGGRYIHHSRQRDFQTTGILNTQATRPKTNAHSGESRSEKMRPARCCIRKEQQSVFLAYITIPFMAINYCAATCGRPAPGRKREECLRVLSRGVYGFDTANPPQKPSPTAPCQRWARILTGEIWDGFANYDEKTLAG